MPDEARTLALMRSQVLTVIGRGHPATGAAPPSTARDGPADSDVDHHPGIFTHLLSLTKELIRVEILYMNRIPA